MSAPQPGTPLPWQYRDDYTTEGFNHAWIVGDTVLWSNGIEGKVCGVDFDDCTLMDHCGGWHDMAEVDLLEVAQ